ncbi:MAG: hypothetical protein FWC30_00920 [Candidatus Bathyarchaeota archaeon]|nr:hypothetical protein [Candidatus Termiticorpusculum sp.]
MTNLTRNIHTLFKKRNTTKIASFTIIAILLFSSLFAIGSIFTTPTDQQQKSKDTTTLTIPLKQSKNYTHKGITYELKYIQNDERNLIEISNGQTPITYPAVAGTTYEIFNLIISIDKANEQNITLQITPSTK